MLKRLLSPFVFLLTFSAFGQGPTHSGDDLVKLLGRMYNDPMVIDFGESINVNYATDNLLRIKADYYKRDPKSRQGDFLIKKGEDDNRIPGNYWVPASFEFWEFELLSIRFYAPEKYNANPIDLPLGISTAGIKINKIAKMWEQHTGNKSFKDKSMFRFQIQELGDIKLVFYFNRDKKFSYAELIADRIFDLEDFVVAVPDFCMGKEPGTEGNGLLAFLAENFKTSNECEVLKADYNFKPVYDDNYFSYANVEGDLQGDIEGLIFTTFGNQMPAFEKGPFITGIKIFNQGSRKFSGSLPMGLSWQMIGNVEAVKKHLATIPSAFDVLSNSFKTSEGVEKTVSWLINCNDRTVHFEAGYIQGSNPPAEWMSVQLDSKHFTNRSKKKERELAAKLADPLIPDSLLEMLGHPFVSNYRSRVFRKVFMYKLSSDSTGRFLEASKNSPVSGIRIFEDGDGNICKVEFTQPVTEKDYDKGLPFGFSWSDYFDGKIREGGFDGYTHSYDRMLAGYFILSEWIVGGTRYYIRYDYPSNDAPAKFAVSVNPENDLLTRKAARDKRNAELLAAQQSRNLAEKMARERKAVIISNLNQIDSQDLFAVLNKNWNTAPEVEKLKQKSGAEWYLLENSYQRQYQIKDISGLYYQIGKGTEEQVSVLVFNDLYDAKLPFGLKWNMTLDEMAEVLKQDPSFGRVAKYSEIAIFFTMKAPGGGAYVCDVMNAAGTYLGIKYRSADPETYTWNWEHERNLPQTEKREWTDYYLSKEDRKLLDDMSKAAAYATIIAENMNILDPENEMADAFTKNITKPFPFSKKEGNIWYITLERSNFSNYNDCRNTAIFGAVMSFIQRPAETIYGSVSCKNSGVRWTQYNRKIEIEAGYKPYVKTDFNNSTTLIRAEKLQNRIRVELGESMFPLPED